MTTYFEASAIVKLVVAEEGSDRAGLLWDSSDMIATSTISYAEIRAALAAARRAGRLTRTEHSEAKRALEDRFRRFDQVDVSVDLVRTAGDLAEEHGLRGYDAIHLASALAVGTAELILVTWDAALAKAGRRVGFDLAGIGIR